MRTNAELNQEFEDSKWDRAIENEAKRLYIMYLNAPEITIMGEKHRFAGITFPIPPGDGIYYIHNEATARHKNMQFADRVRERYKELLKELEK